MAQAPVAAPEPVRAPAVVAEAAVPRPLPSVRPVSPNDRLLGDSRLAPPPLAPSTPFSVDAQFHGYKTATLPPLGPEVAEPVAESPAESAPVPAARAEIPPAPFAEAVFEPESYVPDERAELPLVSPHTDAAVSSAFSALIASQHLPSDEALRDMAREMLRPMLKAWLDDNLPVLVERLVRAEIERVARGGR